VQARSASEPLTLGREAVEPFRRDMLALTGAEPVPGRPLGVAVSGGPDSVALLLLAHAAFPGAVIAATVDHGLRPEAAEEAALVRRLCNQLDVSHDTLSGTVSATGNLQQGARELRYALLADWARGRTGWIATAHQQDDVAETFLMRARRGAGVGGLAAMAAARPLGEALLVRPLLGWRRERLLGLVAGAGIAPVRDPSNQDPRFDRARIRALLAESGDLPADRLAAAARNLRDAEDALAWALNREWTARAALAGNIVTIDPAGLPRELRRRLADRAVATVRALHGLGPDWRETGLDPLLAQLDAGGTGTVAEVLARTKAGIWRFELAPPRRSH
jgi:tRNA(Ile)-lysidine synthase